MNKKLLNIVIFSLAFMMIANLVGFSEAAINFDSQRSNISKRPPWERDNPPTCNIVSPLNGENVDGIVHISVEATDDNGVDLVTITVDGYTHTGNTYDWDTAGLSDGNYIISAEATDTIAQTSTDYITVSIGGGSSGGDGIVNRFAVIIGISDYSAINDLNYCDEDASDWYNYLEPLGYEITLLGDGTNTYPVPIDGLATEYNMKQAVADILAVADEDDVIVYATSGHGSELKSGNGRTATYNQLICAWDYGVGENGEDGKLFDYEFAQMWAPAVSNVFIFVDHCFAGGMDELFDNPNADCFYMTTTCTADGYGYDVSEYDNGKWTYWYLEAGLIGESFTDLHECFVWAHANYDFNQDKDEPMEFGVADFTL